MGEQKEQPKFRPNERIFNEKIHYIKSSKESDPDAYYAYLDEIPLFAKGEGDQDTKEEFYPGWIEEDFVTLWEKMKAEGLVEE